MVYDETLFLLYLVMQLSSVCATWEQNSCCQNGSKERVCKSMTILWKDFQVSSMYKKAVEGNVFWFYSLNFASSLLFCASL